MKAMEIESKNERKDNKAVEQTSPIWFLISIIVFFVSHVSCIILNIIALASGKADKIEKGKQIHNALVLWTVAFGVMFIAVPSLVYSMLGVFRKLNTTVFWISFISICCSILLHLAIVGVAGAGIAHIKNFNVMSTVVHLAFIVSFIFSGVISLSVIFGSIFACILGCCLK